MTRSDAHPLHWRISHELNGIAREMGISCTEANPGGQQGVRSAAWDSARLVGQLIRLILTDGKVMKGSGKTARPRIFVVGARGIPDMEGGAEKNAEAVFPLLVEA